MHTTRLEIVKDAEIKRHRVREYLFSKNLDAVMISTREHFSWITSGGGSHVVRNSNIGFGTLLITADRAYLLAHSMDADRLMDEQVEGQGYELIRLHWYDGDVRARAVEMGGKRIGSDTSFPGTSNVYEDLVDLHYPMTDLEIERLRWLAGTTDHLFTTAAREIKPGDTEIEVASRLHEAHLRDGMEVDVLIVGSDERCFKYRHPLPTEKKIKQYVMLHTVARRWGLHCNLTRFVHFGDPGSEILNVHNAAIKIVANVILSLKPGVKFSDIFAWQKKWYAEQGYPEEWRNHFQGGPTGYVIVDATRCLTDKVIQINQPYEWFITITGTKMGELVLLSEQDAEVCSFIDSKWPEKAVETSLGKISLPDIYIL